MEVLASIVRLYVSGGQPIGSKAVAEELAESLSSATIRNIMAELEAVGLLAQPHVSAGRVPTDRAYRLYVDRVASQAELGASIVRHIDETLAEPADAPEVWMGRLSRLLSEVSRNVGLVLAPTTEEKLLEHVKFVALPERRVLAVVVSKPDLIENKVIRTEDEISQAELDRAADFLNAEFRGWSLRTIRLEIFKRMENIKVVCDTLLGRIAALFEGGALGAQESGALFVDGAAKILDQPEWVDVRLLRGLLETFEQKAKLVKMLSACLESANSGVRIVIGRENPEREMHCCSFVVAPYCYQDRPVGALGVLGPTRMEYARAIKTVEYIASLTSRLLSAN